jgi:hypothetical protein
MLINNLENLEKKLQIISGVNINERSFSKKRLRLLEELYSELKLLKSNFEARSLSLYIRSLIKFNFSEKYPIHAFGVGIVVHYGPGNLPINSIYSWVTGFICGNVNIVRSSTKTTNQQLEIINLVSNLCLKNSFLDIFTLLKESYEYANLTSKYSQARVIWGSDSTVNMIRKLDCNPKCRDIIFSDRKSAAIFNFDLIDQYNEKRKKYFSAALANDLLYANSQPCTSPSVLFLISEKNNKNNLLAKMKTFLIQAEALANKKEDWNLLSFSSQIEHLQNYALNEDQPLFLDIKNARSKLAFVSSPTLQKRLFRTFEIIVVKHFDDLSQELLNKFNIFVYDGITQDQKYLLSSNSNCTKVVPVGNAHQFNLIWDGIDTVRSLIRIPEIS